MDTLHQERRKNVLFGHLKAGTLRQTDGVMVTSNVWQEKKRDVFDQIPKSGSERTKETGKQHCQAEQITQLSKTPPFYSVPFSILTLNLSLHSYNVVNKPGIRVAVILCSHSSLMVFLISAVELISNVAELNGSIFSAAANSTHHPYIPQKIDVSLMTEKKNDSDWQTGCLLASRIFAIQSLANFVTLLQTFATVELQHQSARRCSQRAIKGHHLAPISQPLISIVPNDQ